MKKKKKSMILRPVKHGKRLAFVLPDQMLKEAGLSKNASLQLTVTSEGLLLQAADTVSEDEALKTFKKIKRKYARLFRNLADR